MNPETGSVLSQQSSAIKPSISGGLSVRVTWTFLVRSWPKSEEVVKKNEQRMMTVMDILCLFRFPNNISHFISLIQQKV